MRRLFVKAVDVARASARSLGQTEPVDQLRLLTLALLLGHCYRDWYMRGSVPSLALAGILFPVARRHPLLWFSLSAVLAVWVYNQWFSVMNHDYLIAYWVTSLAFAGLLPLSDQRRALATAGRWMLGGVMALATFHKLISPSYTGGDFMEFILLCDRRFEHMAWIIGGVDLERLSANAHEVVHWVQEASGPARDLLVPAEGWRLNSLGWVLTWGTVFIEGAIALAFLLPVRGTAWIRIRVLLMIVFIALTYPIAPVVGFAWILVVLTLATLPADFRSLRLGLTLMFVALPLVYLNPARVFNSLFDDFRPRDKETVLPFVKTSIDGAGDR